MCLINRPIEFAWQPAWREKKVPQAISPRQHINPYETNNWCFSLLGFVWFKANEPHNCLCSISMKRVWGIVYSSCLPHCSIPWHWFIFYSDCTVIMWIFELPASTKTCKSSLSRQLKLNNSNATHLNVLQWRMQRVINHPVCWVLFPGVCKARSLRDIIVFV